MPSTAPPPPKGNPSAPPSRPPGTSSSPSAQAGPARKVKLREVPSALPPRLVVFATEGFGKTTLGACAPEPLILMSRGETGYDTLLQSKLVPQVPAEVVVDWQDLLGWIDGLTNDPQGRKTLVLDTLGGFERLCHEHVCREHFKSDWTETGFASYQKGYDLAVTDWIGLLSRLDRLRAKGVTILWLGHSRIHSFKNPLGPDFDRYICDCHPKTWGVTHRWADAVLFGNFLTVLDNEEKAKRAGKGKAIGGTTRILFTERRDAYDAKNRYGMKGEIWLEDGPAASWSTLWAHLQTNGAEHA